MNKTKRIGAIILTIILTCNILTGCGKVELNYCNENWDKDPGTYKISKEDYNIILEQGYDKILDQLETFTYFISDKRPDGKKVEDMSDLVKYPISTDAEYEPYGSNNIDIKLEKTMSWDEIEEKGLMEYVPLTLKENYTRSDYCMYCNTVLHNTWNNKKQVWDIGVEVKLFYDEENKKVTSLKSFELTKRVLRDDRVG